MNPIIEETLAEPEETSIVVIDDTPISLRSLTSILERAGYNAKGTEDPLDGVDLIRSVKPDLVLLDIKMPDLDGYELCQILKNDIELREIPVIFISGLQDTEEKVEAFRQGGVDYITKPFAEDEVLARARAQISLKRSRDRMARINRNLRVIFSVISHDLRNPFVGLLSFPEIVASDVEMTKDELQDLAECTLDEAHSALNMFDEMLEWARAQSNSGDLSLQDVDLNELASKVENQASMWAHAKSIGIKNRITAPTIVKADAKIVATILRNLLSNAIKFTPENGNVALEVERNLEEPNSINLIVRDSGIGMNKDQIEDLLSAGKVEPRAGTSNEKGSGIGLMLSQMLLQDIGTSLSINSSPGSGSEFRIPLKLATGAES